MSSMTRCLYGAIVALAGLAALGCAASAGPPPAADLPPAAALPTPAPTPGSWSNTIRWATASEVENLGYNVYRGESEDGPWTRVNPELIPGAGTTDEPTRYRFVDDTIDPRVTYFYWVESVSIDGVRERFTPIARVKPKLEPTPTP